jgi:hypothetical protein
MKDPRGGFLLQNLLSSIGPKVSSFLVLATSYLSMMYCLLEPLLVHLVKKNNGKD